MRRRIAEGHTAEDCCRDERTRKLERPAEAAYGQPGRQGRARPGTLDEELLRQLMERRRRPPERARELRPPRPGRSWSRTAPGPDTPACRRSPPPAVGAGWSPPRRASRAVRAAWTRLDAALCPEARPCPPRPAAGPPRAPGPRSRRRCWAA